MKKTWVWIVAGGALLVALVVAAILKLSGSASELAELIAEDGQVLLRDPMRPIRGTTRVLIFALDGVGDSKLREAIQSGRMPRTAGLFGALESGDVFAHAYAVPDALSILPSTTMAAWASVFSGEPVSRTGIAGNEWFEREEMRFQAPAPVSIAETDHTVQLYSDDFLGRAMRVPTLFERAGVRAHVSLAPVSRGADLLTLPTGADVARAFAAVAAGVIEDEPAERELYSALDEGSVDSLLEAFECHGIPNLQVVYLPGSDLYAHVAESALDELARYLEEITDPLIGRVLAAYEEAGALERTYVLFISDHGHTPVLEDELHALATDEEGDPPVVLRQAGFRVRPFTLEVDADQEDYQATLAYQGAFAYVYLADRSTCPQPGERCSWMLPPRLEEDVLPVVRAFDRANRFGEGVPKLHGALDLILSRQPRPLGEDAAAFEVWDGARLVPIREYLARTPRPDLADFEGRMRALAEGPYGHRAGDILLLAKSGANRPIGERYYFSNIYHSWHGSPEWQDSRIPLIVARAADSGQGIREHVDALLDGTPSQLDVVRLVLDLLQR